MTKIPRQLAAGMPPKTAVPTARWVAASASVAMTSGSRPTMKAKEVIITMGKRRLAAVVAASPPSSQRSRHGTLLAFSHGELDDQSGVLGCEGDQHDDADLREQVVVEPAQPLRRHGVQQAGRYRQQRRDRDCRALVEGDEEQVGEQEGKGEDEAGLPGRR